MGLTATLLSLRSVDFVLARALLVLLLLLLLLLLVLVNLVESLAESNKSVSEDETRLSFFEGETDSRRVNNDESDVLLEGPKIPGLDNNDELGSTFDESGPFAGDNKPGWGGERTASKEGNASSSSSTR